MALCATACPRRAQPRTARHAGATPPARARVAAAAAGALVGALHGGAWLRQQTEWWEQLERAPDDEQRCFDALRATAALAAGRIAPGGERLVRCTRDMGRDGALMLARLLALLDTGDP